MVDSQLLFFSISISPFSVSLAEEGLKPSPQVLHTLSLVLHDLFQFLNVLPKVHARLLTQQSLLSHTQTLHLLQLLHVSLQHTPLGLLQGFTTPVCAANETGRPGWIGPMR